MLVLASASPRRRELLALAGFRFVVRPAGIAEQRRPGEAPIAFSLRLAAEKAAASYASLSGEEQASSAVLGADTIVVLDGEVMGKPGSAEDAVRMLARLSGRTHQVITGVALMTAAGTQTAAEVTWVRFRPLGGAEIAAYVAGGEPMDKAGGYAIQGQAARWIPRIEGCYFNVVGLPVALVTDMLEALPGREALISAWPDGSPGATQPPAGA